MEAVFCRLRDGDVFVGLDQIRDGISGMQGLVLIAGAEPTDHPQWDTIQELICSRDKKTFVITSHPSKVSRSTNVTVGVLVDTVLTEEAAHISPADVLIIPLVASSVYRLNSMVRKARNQGIERIILFYPGAQSQVVPVAEHEYIPVDAAAAQTRLVMALFPGVILADNIPLCLLGDLEQHDAGLLVAQARSQRPRCHVCAKKDVCKGAIASIRDEELRPVNLLKDVAEHVAGQLTNHCAVELCAEDVLDIFDCCDGKDVWSIAQDVGMAILLVARVLRMFMEHRIVHEDAGRFYAMHHWTPQAVRIDVSDMRCVEDRSFAQLRVCEEDLKVRAAYIAKAARGQRKVLVLGDDDFLSLLLAAQGVFDDIVVLDIDPRVVSRINEVAATHRLPVRARVHDLRDPLPQDLIGMVDVCCFDPPYTGAGFRLFLSRSVEAIGQRPGKHVFCAFTPRNPAWIIEGEAIESAFAMGLVLKEKGVTSRNDVPKALREKYPDLSSLEAAAKDYITVGQNDQWLLAALGRKELVLHLLSTEFAHPLVTGKVEDAIYNADEPLRFTADRDFIREIRYVRRRRLGGL
ncbi:bis-aminopropyl spermidine synthase family protein [Candidatus Woesearchaeota archaeon]|nr:bis-aminopropyl spermidine synthase family protein [Candidatus Woesearchaeota archaeon]